MRGLVGFRHVAGILLVLVAGWAWVWVFDRPAQAQTVGCRLPPLEGRGEIASMALVCLPPIPPPAFLAGALACPPGVEGADCTRETALDVLVQPVALVTECPMVGTLLATHLSLPPGGTHKTFCERRKG